MASKQGTLEAWALEHQRSLDPEGGLELEGFEARGDFHERPTLPEIEQPLEPSRIRPMYWSTGFARARFEQWARVRNWVAVRLARLASRVAP